MIDPSGKASLQSQLTTLSVLSALSVGAISGSYGSSLNIRYSNGELFAAYLLMSTIINNSLAELVALNTRHTIDVIEGQISAAEREAEKIGGIGGGPEDPDPNERVRRHWQKEVKAMLSRAKRLAEKRLKGKTRDRYLERIQRIARKAGVEI